jgi:hypothetical protein
MHPGEATVSTKHTNNDNVDVTPSSGTGAIVLCEAIDRSRLETLTALKNGQGVDAWIKLAKTFWRQCSKKTGDSRVLWHTCHFVRKLYNNGSIELPFGHLYSKAHGHLKGKYQASLVDIDSSLRAFPANGRARELDVSKSQPTILMHWAGWLGLHQSETFIRYYVDNDKQRLNTVIEAMQLVDGPVASAEDQAKNLITRLMFSGTLKQWQEDNCIREEPPQFVHRLAEHVYKVFQALERQLGWQHYKRDAECLRDRSNSKRSARAWFLQHQEGLICASIAEAVQKQGFLPTTLAHDAVYILADGSERLDIQDMEQHVQRQTAYSLKLRFKDIPDKPELLSAFERAGDETAKAIRDVEATLGAFSIRYP